MDLKISCRGGRGVIHLIGQLWEREDFGAFLDAANELLEQKCSALVVDLSRLTFVSSQGLGAFVKTYTRARDADCAFVLYKPLGSVREVMELAGFDRFMTIADTIGAIEEDETR